jgi:hypothetical protein
MSRRSQPAACTCGQVFFDTDGRKHGDVLTCPWCQKTFRYMGGNEIEPYEATSDEKPKHAGEKVRSKDKDEKRKERKKDKGDEIKEVSDDLEVVEGSEEVKVIRIPAAPDSITKKSKRSDRPNTGTRPHQPVGEGGPPRAPSLRLKPAKEIPGGVGVMIGFVIGFNALAFIAMSLLFVTQSDKSRLTPWGQVVPAKAFWPEMVALLVGHVVGFIAWSCYVYNLQQRQKAAAAEAMHSGKE